MTECLISFKFWLLVLFYISHKVDLEWDFYYMTPYDLVKDTGFR